MKDVDPNIAGIIAGFSKLPGIKDPLIGAIEQAQPLDPEPACATCPASFWYWDTELICFCKVKKDDTWGGAKHGIIACSEREMLLTLPQPH